MYTSMQYPILKKCKGFFKELTGEVLVSDWLVLL